MMDGRIMRRLDNLAKQIPGGATILWEEHSVQSDTYECNGEAIHEEWNDDETAINAVTRLYGRIKRAEVKG